MYTGRKGQGAFCNQERLHVTKETGRCLIYFFYSYAMIFLIQTDSFVFSLSVEEYNFKGDEKVHKLTTPSTLPWFPLHFAAVNDIFPPWKSLHRMQGIGLLHWTCCHSRTCNCQSARKEAAGTVLTSHEGQPQCKGTFYFS